MPFRFRKRAHPERESFNPHHCTCPPKAREDSLPLSDAPTGSTVYICCLHGNRRLARRLGEMGFIPGTPVTVVRRAPFADPVEYKIRGYLISLRRAEAAMIRVKPVLQTDSITSDQPATTLDDQTPPASCRGHTELLDEPSPEPAVVDSH